MSSNVLKDIKSKYKGVYYFYDRIKRCHYWVLSGEFNGLKTFKSFPYTDDGERLAAIAYDMKKIEIGRNPVNILKPKK